MRKKRTCTNTFEFISWDRVDIVACSCPEKTYLHVHCPCEQCEGKATSRKVELEHWKRSQLLRAKRVKQDENLHESNTTFGNQEQETPQESNLDLSEEDRMMSNSFFSELNIHCLCYAFLVFISVGKILCCNQSN